VLEHLPLAGLSEEQYQNIERWLKGGIASSMGDLTQDVAGAVLHYYEVGLHEYLGPELGGATLQRSFTHARQRLANVGIDPIAVLAPTAAAAERPVARAAAEPATDGSA
jgi:hypothetical protein